MKIRKTRLFLVLVIVLCNIMSAWNLLSITNPELDTEKNPVFAYITADSLLSNIEQDPKSCNGDYYAVRGRIKSINKSNKEFIMMPNSLRFEKDILCDGKEKGIYYVIEDLSVGSEVLVLGKLRIDPIDKDIHLIIEQINEKIPAAIENESFFVKDKTYKQFNVGDLKQKILGNGSVQYRIPDGWNAVEQNIQRAGIGELEGNQYVLNQMGENKGQYPENLFVCYFDYSLYVEQKDLGKTDQIELAIMNDILGDADINRLKAVTTPYGKQYRYYTSQFTKTDGGLQSTNLNVEFIFVPMEKKGTAVVIYVYYNNDKNRHMGDIMAMLRLMEVR